MQKMNVAITLVIIFSAVTYAAEVVNVAPGVFSKKVVSDGLNLPASNTFSPINTLTTTVHLDKPYSVFVHHQFTMGSTGYDFYSKLLVNDNNAGSMVHNGKQQHKISIGFWMANLNAGHYTFEIQYVTRFAKRGLIRAQLQVSLFTVIRQIQQ